MDPASSPKTRPLDGIRVLEIGQLLAGPFAGTLLAYFGADVVKVEPPSGDPIRSWRHVEGGTSLWWRTLGRNKRCVRLDLRTDPGRRAVRALAGSADILIENFRPGTMEAWGLGPDVLCADNPGLVYTRISGFGQDGPDRRRPGFASVCEAIAGLRFLTGHPGQPPVRPNLSLGDSLGGLHACIGILLALLERHRSGRGQVIDVSLVESVLNVLESVLVEERWAGVVRQPSGTGLTGIVPSNAYPCRDDQHVVIGANGRSLFERLMHAIDRPDLAGRPDLQENPGRVAAQKEVDEAITTFTRQLDAEEVEKRLRAADVPVGKIQTAADIARDPQVRARGWFERIELAGRTVELPKMAPRLQRTPGQTTWVGREIGEDDTLLSDLGLSDEELRIARGLATS